MAYIEYLTSNTIEFLHTKHLFGRKNPVANKSVTCHSVSRNHASIEWDGKQWLIQDLSRNGTWVNNKRLKPNLLKELQVGDKVTLGSNNKEGVNFKVCNTDAPKSLIYRPFPSLQAIAINESNLIPDLMSPDFGLFYCHDRKNWYSETFSNQNSSSNNLDKGPHAHGSEILYAGNRWTLFLLDQDKASTPIANIISSHINDYEFQVAFNRNNDDIRLTLLSKEKEIELKPQPYTRLIAELINLQQNSKDGWVSFEDLSNTTGSNEDNINLQLFMLRHHLQSTLKNCKGVSKLVNFNDSFLRLEIQHFSIYRNGKLEQSSDYHR